MGSQLSAALKHNGVSPSAFSATKGSPPMLVISLEKLRQFGRLPMYQEAVVAGILEDCHAFERPESLVVHVTHHLLQPGSISSNHSDIFQLIMHGVDAMVSGFGETIDIYLWIAPVCLHDERADGAAFEEDVTNLAYFMSQCDVMFTPVLDASNNDERFKNWLDVDNESSDWQHTKAEGWCRLDFVMAANIPRKVNADHYFERMGYKRTSSNVVQVMEDEDSVGTAKLASFVEEIEDDKDYEVVFGAETHTQRRKKVSGNSLKKQGCWEERPHLLFGPLEEGRLICLPPFRNAFMSLGQQPEKGRFSNSSTDTLAKSWDITEDKNRVKRIMKTLVPLLKHRVVGYLGDIKGGQPQGIGTKVYKSGHVYHGRWAAGKIEGKGLFEYADGSSYEGEWKQNKQAGPGLFRYRNGDWYSGNWRQGKREGTGTIELANGNRYTGEWAKDHTSGNGKITWAGGESYSGEFVAGEIHGKGVLMDLSENTKAYHEGASAKLCFEHGGRVEEFSEDYHNTVLACRASTDSKT